MFSYLLKWMAASLTMPLLVLLLGHKLSEMVVLLFWPGSLVLMSLGARENSLVQVAGVWAIGITLNVILYMLIGLLFHYVVKYKTGKTN